MMKRASVAAFAAAFAGAVVAGAAFAAGPTNVDHFSDGPFADNICGVDGSTVVHGTSVFRDNGDGTFFASGTFRAVFTADSGKSITISAAGPAKVTSPPVIDTQAGTVTQVITFVGIPEKLSITSGPTLSRDSGIVTQTQVYAYTGDPDNPFGDFISRTSSGLHGPHPDLVSDFAVFCDVLGPYLQAP
jgi:hypothetical protein